MDDFKENTPPVVFKNEGDVIQYYVYRLEKPPKSYNSFMGKWIAILPAKDRSTFIDDIEPNKKYYYTFAVQDNRWNLSNPTSVYEVEMVENSGATYPIIKVVNFDELQKGVVKNEKHIQKEFKKYLYIKPAIQQLYFNEDKSIFTEEFPGLPGSKKRISSAYDTTPVLGLSEQSAMNQTFKFRITSKKTGKKIDFNVTFKEKLKLNKPS